MKEKYIFEPEVPGRIGPRTQMDRSVHPPRIRALHFVFDGWLGDQLVESFPCYLVTSSLAESLAAAGVTGFALAEAEVETGEPFREVYPGRLLPPFKWLQVVGNADADVYITSDNRLAGSQKTLDVILATNPVGFEFRQVTTGQK